MTTLQPIPRRGTPVRRVWLLRAVIVGALPSITVFISLASVLVMEASRVTGAAPWVDLAGWAIGAWIAITVLAFVAVFDADTRVAAVCSFVVAILVNPFTITFAKAVTGL